MTKLGNTEPTCELCGRSFMEHYVSLVPLGPPWTAGIFQPPFKGLYCASVTSDGEPVPREALSRQRVAHPSGQAPSPEPRRSLTKNQGAKHQVRDDIGRSH
jgi:hypothetical protein